jgi:hypothetical protein
MIQLIPCAICGKTPELLSNFSFLLYCNYASNSASGEGKHHYISVGGNSSYEQACLKWNDFMVQTFMQVVRSNVDSDNLMRAGSAGGYTVSEDISAEVRNFMSEIEEPDGKEI